MGKLFGTDGIRGVVNAGLDADLAYKVGLAAAEVLAKGKQPGEKPLVTIGKDTRISGDLLKGSLIAGLCTAGADVLDLGTLPTPGVAWVTVDEGADAGIVISASHNPFEHNGIKIFNGQGFKLSDELEEKIEEIVLFGHNDVPRKTHGEIGKVSYVAPKASEDYIDHLESTIDSTLGGLRILVDAQVDYSKNRNQALTSVIFVAGLSGIALKIGSIQLTGMVLACVVGMVMSLVIYLLDRAHLTNDQD